MTMSTRLVNLVVDAADPGRLAAFWAELLGWRVVADLPEESAVRAPESDGWELDLVFVPVDEPKVGQNRLHLDLASPSEQDRLQRVETAVRLGARTIDIGQRGVPWTVLADPAGNEFCVRELNDWFVGTGAVAAILVDATDPTTLAEFWVEASGWKAEHNTGDCVSLRSPSGRGPWLELWSVQQAKRGKNRLHLDVAPPVDGDLRAEVDRLVAVGARLVDVGQRDVPWTVLADPEGNELCVLTPR